jgi:hypothetical protein
MESREYIPPPVTKENKAEYFEELSNIRKADEWVKKHSVKVQPIENIEPKIKPENQMMELGKESSGFRKALFVVLSGISFLAFYIISMPNVDFIDFFIYLLFFLIIPLAFMVWSPKNNEWKNQSSNSVNNTEQNYEEKVEEKQFSFFLLISDIMKYTIITLLIILLFMMIFIGPILDSLFSGGCYGVCGLSGWGGP